MMAERGSSSGSGSENGDSRNSSSRSSASEEERLRRLFNSCDADGDGYLDGEDLTFMCRMLNMADSVGEVRQQLGLTDESRLSFHDFLRCRTRVMLESSALQQPHQQSQAHDLEAVTSPALLSAGEDTGIESDASGVMGNVQPASQMTLWPTLSSDSLGALSCTKPDSADYDSGARDLSPEPVTMTLTQLMDTHDPQAMAQLRKAGADSLLDIADRLHAAALTSLKGEVIELKNHMHRLTSDRNLLDPQKQNHPENKLGPSDFEDRLEQLTSRYEERIIELHSVIAELRKKLERHQINVIREEEEYEESEQGQSTRSNDGESLNEKDENTEICQEFSRVVSEIQTAMAAKPLETPPSGGREEDEEERRRKASQDVPREEGEEGDQSDPAKPSLSETPGSEPPPELPPRAARPCTLPHGNSSATFTLDPQARSEVGVLQADNEELRRQTSQLEVELGHMAGKMAAVVREKEALIGKVYDLQQHLQTVTSATSPSHSRVATPTKQTVTPPPPADRRGSEQDNFPVAKIAELKKLRTCVGDMQGILGSEVAMMGVQSTSTAEHLVQSLQDGSNMAELLTSAGAHGHAHFAQGAMKEFEVELERRQARIDHLKAQNDVLSATLEESKSHSERLSVLMGKYESNHTAMHLAAAFSDHCLEALDVLTALLDSEMGVLLANCRAAGLGGFAVTEGEDDLEVTSILQRAHHARRRAESVARLLLSRLDRSCAGHMTSSGGCQPWEDVSTNSRTASTSSTSSSTELDFAKTDELRLREHIQQLKTERSAVRTTVMELESAHVDPLALEPRGRVEAQRLDLENAVLVQELMAVKEEKAELKARSYLLEKEKRALELRLSGKETQETAYRIQIEHLQGELELVAGEHPPHAPLTSPSPSSPRSGASGHQHHHHQSSRTTTASSKQQQQQQQHLPDAWKVTEMASRDANDLARDFLLSLERERVLKWRVSELMSTLEKISRNSESGHKQWAQFVNDLKRANSALISAFDKARKKYQGRLKKMEGQLKGWKEKYDADTAALRQRLSVLEGTRGGGGGVRTPPTPQPPPSETSL